jgi:acyl-CoA thioesterase-1
MLPPPAVEDVRKCVSLLRGGKAVQRRLLPMLVFAGLAFIFILASNPAAAQVVALGASQTYGKGVDQSQSYPAQLESMLRAKGYKVHVENAGINGDTTGGMLSRLDSAVPKGTRVVILQPGGNDMRRGSGASRGANISAIVQRLNARHVRVVVLENGNFRGLPRQADGLHLTPEGYRAIAQRLLPQVSSALGH